MSAHDSQRHPVPAPAPAAQSGFTLIEVVLVSALLAVAVGAVAMSVRTTTQSLTADDLVARAMETLQRSAVRIALIARPCAITTYRVLSDSADVPVRATAPGEWIEPMDAEERSSIRFAAADGRLSMNAASLTTPRTFRLVLDDGETANAADDDGDGMIDEGRVTMTYNGTDVVMASNVESCTFELTGRLLTIRMRSAARGRGDNVQRFAIEETIYLRNN